MGGRSHPWKETENKIGVLDSEGKKFNKQNRINFS
jgi:hypothetical protein